MRLGTWLPFERVPGLLAFLTGVHLSVETVRRLTEAAGAALVAVEAAEGERLDGEQPEPPAGPTVQQVSADGAMVPLVQGEWAEVKTLVVGRVETRTSARGERTVHATDLSYASRLADAGGFGGVAGAELHRRGTLGAERVVGVMDGAEWLQRFLDLHCPAAVRVLDFPHAVEHVAAAAQASLGTGTPATAAWLAEQAHTLKHGDPAQVLVALAALPVDQALDASAARQVQGETLAYLAKRWEQIQYVHFQAQGWPIGSGAVESGNKLVVEARLKGSGMHWARPNVNPMVALRAVACSDRWEAGWPPIVTEQRRQARARRQRRCQARLARTAPAPAPPPADAVPAAPPAPVAPAPRPPTIVNGRPTDRHPWKHFPLLHRRRPRPAASAKS